jgi:hypothetical protein
MFRNRAIVDTQVRGIQQRSRNECACFSVHKCHAGLHRLFFIALDIPAAYLISIVFIFNFISSTVSYGKFNLCTVVLIVKYLSNTTNTLVFNDK